MSRVYPRLYDRNLAYLGDLRTAKFGYKLKQVPLDTATITVPIEDAGQIGMRQFVELYDDDKRVELFRVARIADKSYKQGGTCKFACDQALCTLKDNLIPGYHEIGGVGMGLRACIEWVLARQSPVRWRLGRCDYDTYYQYSLEDTNLLVALLSLAEPLSDYMFTTDTTQIPWVINLVRLTDNDASELRYRRNMTQIRETVDEDGFCTRLYPYGYGEGVNKLTIADVNNGAPYLDAPTQVLYGVVEMPWTDATCTDAVLLKARAEALMREIQNPLTSFTVKALALSAISGEPLDRFVKGHMTRVVYTDYNIALRTRVVEIERPEVLGKPGDVTLTLSTAKADAATTIAELARKAQITELYSQGATTIDSDRLEVNCDAAHPAELEFFLARDYYRVNRVLIKLKVGRYRADSRAAKGGGATVATTSSGGGHATTTSDGGGSTQTSSSGGGAVLTTPAQTTSNRELNTGVSRNELGPLLDTESGGAGTTGNSGSGSTGVSRGADGPMLDTVSGGAGTTGNGGGGSTGVSRGASGPMTATDSGGASTTGNGGGGSTGLSRNESGAMTNTVSGGPTATGTGGPTSTGTGGPTATGVSRNDGGAMSQTGASSPGTTAASPGTSSAGDHDHTIGSHRHSSGGTHRHTISGDTYTSYNGAGDTTYTRPSCDTAGGHSHGTTAHSHTVNSHTHGMSHWHALDAHSHSVSQHTHSVAAHAHGMSHWHTYDAHTHSTPNHAHGMSHWHDYDAHTHSTPNHAHGMSHWHDYDAHTHSTPNHAHGMAHWHTIDGHNHTVPSFSLTLNAHTHEVNVPTHSHGINLPTHTHTTNLPDHTHGIEYGIFEGASVDEITVAVDGNVVPASAIVDSQVDIVPYLAKSDAGKITRETWHRVTVTPVPTGANPEGLCRITIYRHSQVFISGQAGGNF